MDIRPIGQRELADRLDEIAALRILVFAEWPYLYSGDLDYERAYLAPYLSSPTACVIGAFDGGDLVGAATASGMEDHADSFGRALADLSMPLTDIYYFGESVLLPAYRGTGAGHAFFDLREAAARRFGRSHAAFCAVIRPDDHPARPKGYVPLDAFWTKRGYTEVPGAVARFAWTDLGDREQTEKPLQFWIRRLEEAQP